jgi:hypothetical protein
VDSHNYLPLLIVVIGLESLLFILIGLAAVIVVIQLVFFNDPTA